MTSETNVLRLLMPLTWVVAAGVSMSLSSSRRLALPTQAASFAIAGFTTRLVIEHHESRYQIASFGIAAAILELARAWQVPVAGRPSGLFWSVAVLGASVGVIVARPIAHRGLFGL